MHRGNHASLDSSQFTLLERAEQSIMGIDWNASLSVFITILPSKFLSPCLSLFQGFAAGLACAFTGLHLRLRPAVSRHKNYGFSNCRRIGRSSLIRIDSEELLHELVADSESIGPIDQVFGAFYVSRSRQSYLHSMSRTRSSSLRSCWRVGLFNLVRETRLYLSTTQSWLFDLGIQIRSTVFNAIEALNWDHSMRLRVQRNNNVWVNLMRWKRLIARKSKVSPDSRHLTGHVDVKFNRRSLIAYELWTELIRANHAWGVRHYTWELILGRVEVEP